MALREIRLEGDPVLRKTAKPVPKVTKRVHKLIKDMIDTMCEAEGVGLAAPQVGVLERIIVVDPGDGVVALVNPVIEEAEGEAIDVEGCLSMPGVTGYVARAARVVVSGLDEKGKPRRVDGTELMARVLQHEVDHLDGILFTDKATGIQRVDEGES